MEVLGAIGRGEKDFEVPSSIEQHFSEGPSNCGVLAGKDATDRRGPGRAAAAHVVGRRAVMWATSVVAAAQQPPVSDPGQPISEVRRFLLVLAFASAAGTLAAVFLRAWWALRVRDRERLTERGEHAEALHGSVRRFAHGLTHVHYALSMLTHPVTAWD